MTEGGKATSAKPIFLVTSRHYRQQDFETEKAPEIYHDVDKRVSRRLSSEIGTFS